MSECAFARVSAVAFACAVAAGPSPAKAQEATPQQPPSQAAAPAPGEATLPEIVVKSPPETKPAPKAKAKSAAKSKSSGSVAAESNAQSAPPSDPNATKQETATGPFKGYVAKQSATGTKTDTPLKEVPQSITVVGREQMRDQGAQTLPDALRYTSGVVADGYGLDSRNDGVLVRGTEATQFLDGMRRTYGYYTSTIPFEPYGLERIEVLRGPASVLYGQTTVGGILNMVSKRPQAIPYREVTVEYGSFDFKQVKADMTGPLTEDGKWLYRIAGLARDADTQVGYVENDRLFLAPSLTYQPTKDTSITLLADFRSDHGGSVQQFLPWEGTLYSGPNGRIPINRFAGEPGDKYDTDANSVSLLVDHKFDETWSFHQGLRYTDTHNIYDTWYPVAVPPELALLDPTLSPPFLDASHRTMARGYYFADTDTSVLTSDTNLVAKLELGPTRHKVLGGFDYTYYRQNTSWAYANSFTPFDLYAPTYGQPAYDLVYDPNTGLPMVENGELVLAPVTDLPLYRDPENRQTQKGLYVQDQIRLGPWIAVLGLRQDWVNNELEGSPDEKSDALTRRAGLMYEFGFGLTPYVSYAESFIPVSGLNFYGERFKPLEGESLEAGFKYETPGGRFVVNSAVYDMTERNRLASDINNPLNSIQAGEVSIRGFEIEAKGQVTANVKAIANYSYTDAKYEGGDQAGYHVESVPAHLASLWVVYSFEEGALDGWSVGGGVRYVGASWDGYDQFKTPSSTLFDAMLAYETEKWRWSLNAINLEDEYQLTTCLARGDCFIGTARTITTGLTYKF